MMCIFFLGQVLDDCILEPGYNFVIDNSFLMFITLGKSASVETNTIFLFNGIVKYPI